MGIKSLIQIVAMTVTLVFLDGQFSIILKRVQIAILFQNGLFLNR